MLRFLTGCVAGVLVGMAGLWGIYHIVNPAWLEFHGVRVGVDLAVAVCAGIAGGWLACRSLGVCRFLSAFALAVTPLVLLFLWVAEAMSVWGTRHIPNWAWGVPLLSLLSGVVGLRTSRRVPRRRLPSQPAAR
jgi:hypothetical protein